MKSAIAKLAAGSAISQVIGAASIPIVARIYGPEALGAFLIFDAYCDVMAYGSTLALDKALFTSKSSLGNRALIISILTSITLVSIFATLLLWAGITFGLIPLISSPLILLSACFFVVWGRGAFNLFQSLSIKSALFGTIVAAENTRSVLIVAGRIGLGILGFSVTGLITTAIISVWISNIVVARKNLRAVRFSSFRPLLFKMYFRIIKRHRNFVLFEGTGQFLRQLPVRAPVFAIAVYFAASGAGLYSIALILTYRPAEIIVRSVTEVTRSMMSEKLRSNRIQEASLDGLKLLTRVLIAAPTIAILTGSFVYFTEDILFPHTWNGIGEVALANSLYVGGLLAVRPIQIIFSLYNKQHFSLVLEACTAISCFVAIGLVGSLGGSLVQICLVAGIMVTATLLPLALVARRILISNLT